MIGGKSMYFKYLFVIILSSLVFYCSTNTEPAPNSNKYYLDNFNGITETDLNGNIIGNIDLRDWKIPNSFLNKSLFISPYYLSFEGYDFSYNAEKSIEITNVLDSEITIYFESLIDPFHFEENMLRLNPLEKKNISVKFFFSNLPNINIADTNYIGYLDNLIMNNSAGLKDSLSLSGYIVNPDSGIISVTPIPNNILFLPAYPNPCQQSITFEYKLAYQDTLSLFIINRNGSLIKSISNSEHHFPGAYRKTWNLKDESNNDIAPNLYRVFLESETYSYYGDIQIN